MPTVLILSSFVAASRVGGGMQALALSRLGIEPILAPTVQFGRHPGWGAPGGKPVEADTLAAMLQGIDAQGVFGRLDAVITGYFASVDQVAIAARTLDTVRAASPVARLMVDPVMGDEGKGLYVREDVARAIARDLIPRADLIAPNAWELGRLSGRPADDVESAVAAARSLPAPVLVSSVRAGDEIGVVYVDDKGALLATHPRARTAPNGTGDLLTALFTAARIMGQSPRKALAAAIGGVAEAVSAAGEAQELPIESLPARLRASARVRIERL
jgi:pyridoxine kinase